MNLSEMKQILVAGDIQLTKSLGQNFLHDGNQIRRMIEAAELKTSDKVLEIGPGLGPLTERLIEHVGEVLAIEKDARLVEALDRQFDKDETAWLAGAGQTPGSLPEPRAALQLVHDDALDYLKREHRDWGDWKLVANLPFSVASPMLVELAQADCGPERMVVTLQFEVARRLMAKADESDYGVLTLLMQLGYETRGWFKIPASCFFPEPDVDSACVCLVRRQPALLPPDRRIVFAKIVKRAFSQRRKMMLKLLKQDWPAPKLTQFFAELQISLQARAETVSLEQFVRLTQLLSGDSTHE